MERVSEWTDVGGYSRVITTTIIARHDSTTGQRRVVSPQKMKRTRRTAHLRSNILDRDDLPAPYTAAADHPQKTAASPDAGNKWQSSTLWK